MVATSAVTSIMLALLLYGRIPLIALAILCVGVFVGAIAISHGHHHSHDLLKLDGFAYKSHLSKWNAGLKTCMCLVLVVFCVAANSLIVAAVLLVGMSAVSLWSSGVGFTRYLSLLTVPILFVALSGIVLLVEVSDVPIGILSVRFFQWHLCITPESQATTLMVIARAVGSLACLYALALSTPIYEISTFLRRIHVPAIVTDLMLLIYRYVSVLAGALRQMTTATQARLGQSSLRAKWRSFAGVGSNLLVRSFFRAARSFDALEARGYVDELRFDIKERPVTCTQVAVMLGCVALVFAIFACERVLF